MKNKAIRRELTGKFLEGNKLRFAAMILVTLANAVCDVGMAWMLQQLMDAAVGDASSMSVAQSALFTCGMLVVYVLIGMLRCALLPKFLHKAMEQYRNHAFSLITRKSISAFSGENSSLYISALSNDANTIETGYLSQIFSLISQVCIFIGALWMMLWYSPELTIAAVGLSVFPLIGAFAAGGRTVKAEEQVSRRNEGFVAMVKDYLAGFSVIKTFRAEREMLRQFMNGTSELAKAKIRRQRIGIIIGIIGDTAGSVAQFGVFVVGAYLALSGRGVTPGVVMAFVQMMNYIIHPIANVPRLIADRRASVALIDKLASALAENTVDDGKCRPCSADDAIEVRNVAFSYDGEKNVLDGLNAKFEAGKSYAVVGASGCGKSTLLNLLMAGHDNFAGAVEFDGKDIREINTESLYEKVSLIQQNVFVFNSTIRENVTMFRKFPEEEVNRAICLAGLEALIKEKGEDYVCGENGCNLSGGEKQRISIARSLLRKSKVLLVDEATSALDAVTASQVTDAILDIENITRIVVTHSMDESLLRKFDSIMVMKNGKAEETGTFGELMARKEYFYSLYTVAQ